MISFDTLLNVETTFLVPKIIQSEIIMVKPVKYKKEGKITKM